MNKKIAILVASLTMFSLGAFTACNADVNSNAIYSLDCTAFDGVLVYQEAVDYEGLYVVKEVAVGSSSKIAVTESMFTTDVDTSSVGEKQATIRYGESTFSFTYTVKYQVEFEVDGVVVDTQKVLSAEEIEAPTNPTKEGYNFVAWSPAIPTSISDNMTFAATFQEKVQPPALSTVQAEYGDRLASLTLPSSEEGKWQFVDAPTTSVGSVGKNTFNVQFVLNDGTVYATNQVEVRVSKKKITFSDVTKSFVYDGTAKVPSYRLNGTNGEDVNVEYIPFYAGDAIGAGEYEFELSVSDPRYEGTYSGTFAIEKMYVKLSAGTYTISYGEDVPNLTYTAVDKDGKALTEAYLALLDVKLVKPQVTGAGEYIIDFTYSDASNFDVEVQKGKLTVGKTTLDISPLLAEGQTVTYGDKLSSVSFQFIQLGSWSWKNTDANAFIDTPTSYTGVVVFTPKESNNYESLEKSITIPVAKKQVTITVTKNTYTYNASAQKVTYSIDGVLSQDTTPLQVVGADAQTKAGAYDQTIAVQSDKYEGSVRTTLTINKASSSNFTNVQSTLTSYVWDKTARSTLGHIALPTGYAWVKDATTALIIGDNTFKARYTPTDTENYLIEEKDLTFTVTKAQTIITANDQQFDYNVKAEYALQVSANHTDGTLQYAYDYNGTGADALKDAGDYVVTITMPETTFYLGKTETINVTIKPLENTDSIVTTRTATYLETLGLVKFALPPSATGVWTWKEGDTATVGDVGQQTHVAVFTPTNATNYKSREVNVVFTVSKKSVAAPALVNVSVVYDGATHEIQVVASDFYTVTNQTLGVTDVGEYTVTVALKDTSNLEWTDKTTANKTCKLTITEQEVAIPTATGITYDGAVHTPIATTELYTATCSSDLTSAGTHTFTLALRDTKNFMWKDGSKENKTVDFVISKAEVEAPAIESKTYTGETLTADIDTTGKKYAVMKNEGGVDFGSYDVELTLTDDNYKWKNYADDVRTITLSFTIVKNNDNKWETELPTEINWTYGEVQQVPSANATYGDCKVTYYVNGEWVEELPEDLPAGEYTVRFEIEATEEYNGLVQEIPFTVAKICVDIPDVTSATITYDGAKHTVQVTADDAYTITNEAVDVMNVGTYEIKVALEDTANYEWSDKTTADKSWTLVIQPKPIDAPTLSEKDANIDYDGTAHTPILSDEGYTVLNGTHTNAGTYTITAQLQANYVWSDNTYTDKTFTFVIEKALVATPTFVEIDDLEVDYDKDTSYILQVEELVGYKAITGNNQTAHNVGQYKITVTLESDNYYWNVDGTSYTLTFTITEQEVEIPTAASITYDGEKHTPIATTELYTATCSSDLTSAGTHTFTLSLINTTNYMWKGGAKTDQTVDFVIGKAEITFTAPTYDLGVAKYENNINPAMDYETDATATYASGKVDGRVNKYDIPLGQSISGTTGTVIMRAYFIVDESIRGNFTYNGEAIPQNGEIMVEGEIAVKAMAHFITSNGTLYFASIESALKYANDENVNGVVWVEAGAGMNGETAMIKTNCTIPTGVTLNLPHTHESMNTQTDGHYVATQVCVATNGENSTNYLRDMNCCTHIIIAEGVELKNYGTLQIAGELNGGAGGTKYAGHTSHNYAKITLQNGAKINNESATINVFGLIVESTANNGSQVNLNASTMYIPFVVRDFRGGTYMSSIYSKVIAFNEFEVRNVTALTNIANGSVVKAIANLYAAGKHNATTANLIATNETAVLHLSGESAYVVYKYTPEADYFKDVNCTWYTDTWKEGVATVDVYGGATIESMSLTVTLTLLPVPISTSDTQFPMTWRHQVSFNALTNENGEYVTATYWMNDTYKMMPGHTLTINEGAILNIKTAQIYTEEYFYDIKRLETPAPIYQEGHGNAQIIVNGGVLNQVDDQNVGGIGGNVKLIKGTVKADKMEVEFIEVRGTAIKVLGKTISYTLTETKLTQALIVTDASGNTLSFPDGSNTITVA